MVSLMYSPQTNSNINLPLILTEIIIFPSKTLEISFNLCSKIYKINKWSNNNK